MLSLNEAKRIGDRKCRELFGEVFCKRYAEYGGCCYSNKENEVEITYGMNDVIPGEKDRMILTESKYKYTVTMRVNKYSGNITLIKADLPKE